jgi:Histidine kinase-, DNA gyrase B-, and HSP90-like ATPase
VHAPPQVAKTGPFFRDVIPQLTCLLLWSYIYRAIATCLLDHDAVAMSIKRLPDEVVRRLQSSASITTLRHVVIGLLKNSLDAGATKVNITVDFARGNCTVEDNGEGIAPADFQESGILGQSHCKSTSANVWALLNSQARQSTRLMRGCTVDMGISCPHWPHCRSC